MNYKKIFLEQAMLGVNTDLHNPTEVINKCFDLAYKDMFTVGRFYLGGIKTEVSSEFLTLLEKNSYSFSLKLIEKTSEFFPNKILRKDGTHYVTSFGLSQKLVNMMFKYLYVFSEYTKKEIEFSKCDCPLDSIILNSLYWKGHCWSKMEKFEYMRCQELIRKKLNINDLPIGNLEYDFIHWNTLQS